MTGSGSIATILDLVSVVFIIILTSISCAFSQIYVFSTPIVDYSYLFLVVADDRKCATRTVVKAN